jgi:hypothetical protein
MNLNAEQLAILVRTLSQEENDACAERRRVSRASYPGTLSIILCQPPLGGSGTDSTVLSNASSVAVRIANLSSRGIALLHTQPLAAGQRFMIQLPRQIDCHVYILCTVVHCTHLGDDLYNIGSEYTGVVPVETPGRPYGKGVRACA